MAEQWCVVAIPKEGEESEDLKALLTEWPDAAKHSTCYLFVTRAKERALDDPMRHIDLTELTIEELQALYSNPEQPPNVMWITKAQGKAIYQANKKTQTD